MNQKTIPDREQLSQSDCWDLSALYPDPEAWEADLKQLESDIPTIESFRGTLGQSASSLRRCLDFMMDFSERAEALGVYAQLSVSENIGDSARQERISRYIRTAVRAEEAASYQQPEILAIPPQDMEQFLSEKELEPYLIYLERILRYRPHTLSPEEERLLAMQEEANQTPSKTFSALNDVDLDFGSIETPEGTVQLSQTSYQSLMQRPERDIRKATYHQFMGEYEAHANTLAALYAGSVNLDLYRARARNFDSSLEASLFANNIPVQVYDTLVQTVRSGLPALHEYYNMRREILGLDELRLYDTRVPLIEQISSSYAYDEAVEIVVNALRPLGQNYLDIVREGLTGDWVDRYENKGKRSGAFSHGAYRAHPFILMNYREDDIRHVFTLAHEAGHAMHTYFVSSNNPFQHYDYTIFEAEVASTFNEQLVFEQLLKQENDPRLRAYLIGKQIDDIIATLFRQTMFAEFERESHRMAEEGTPLTLDSIRNLYRSLLESYFGPNVQLEETSDLESLRIPHFYRAFYVYQYSTGISAALYLSQKVLSGGEKERERYLSFLKTGGSKYPLEALQKAGVDMQTPEAVEAAVNRFGTLIQAFRKEYAHIQ